MPQVPVNVIMIRLLSSLDRRLYLDSQGIVLLKTQGREPKIFFPATLSKDRTSKAIYVANHADLSSHSRLLSLAPAAPEGSLPPETQTESPPPLVTLPPPPPRRNPRSALRDSTERVPEATGE